MNAPELSADELARVAAFDAAPALAETSPMTRAMLALAEELDGYVRERGRPAGGSYDHGVNLAQADAAEAIRKRVSAVLAAEPEPREVVDRDRLGRWLFERDYRERGLASPEDAEWDEWVERNQEQWRQEADALLAFLAAAVLDAKGGAQ